MKPAAQSPKGIRPLAQGCPEPGEGLPWVRCDAEHNPEGGCAVEGRNRLRGCNDSCFHTQGSSLPRNLGLEGAMPLALSITDRGKRLWRAQQTKQFLIRHPRAMKHPAAGTGPVMRLVRAFDVAGFDRRPLTWLRDRRIRQRRRNGESKAHQSCKRQCQNSGFASFHDGEFGSPKIGACASRGCTIPQPASK